MLFMCFVVPFGGDLCSNYLPLCLFLFLCSLDVIVVLSASWNLPFILISALCTMEKDITFLPECQTQYFPFKNMQ